MTRFILLLAAGVTASAQVVSFGAKIGAPLRDPSSYPSLFTSVESGRWSGGPTVELHLPYRFSIEVDALYHASSQTQTFGVARLGDPATDGGAPYIYTGRTRSKSWEVPILLKYRFLNGPIRPFISAGVSLTHRSGSNSNYLSCLGTPAACTASSSSLIFNESSFTQFRKGPTAGAGIEFKARKVTISPEVRYTHLDQPRGNQVTAMVGFTFGK